MLWSSHVCSQKAPELLLPSNRMSAVSLLRNSVEDLRVHVSELKQQADRDRAALARAHKDKVTHMHCTRMLSVLHVFTVLLVLCRLWN